MAAHRGLWRVWQRCVNPDRFIFLDEAGAATNTTPSGPPSAASSDGFSPEEGRNYLANSGYAFE